MNRMTALGLAAATSVACAAGPAWAHHSFAMFDNAKEITVSGTVRAFLWINPHVFLQVTAPDKDGKPTEWSLEASGPGLLTRQGWKFNSIKPGEKVIAAYSPLRDGRPGGALHYVIKEDGTRLGRSGSPPGATPPPAGQ